ncbi:MAG: replicative DNA helicase [Phycisphaerae bacterium]|nr:replicative DNA helicase [Phycisphaerae bacterium]
MAYDDRAIAGGGDGRGAPRGQRERRQTINLVDVAKIFESLPPHAVEAEMSLLGSMLWDPRVVGDVVTVVKSGSDFYRPAHGLIYDTMVELYDRNGSLDLVTLSQKLVDKAILEEVGGLDYLVELAEGVPSAVNAPHYAGIVREKATVRELIAAAGEILTDAHQSREPAQDLLERAEQKIFHIAQRRESNSTAEIRDLINETMKLLEQNEGRHLTGVTSGFVDLDEMLSGFQRGELIILAARPSMGKTALALNFVENMASASHPVAVFSLEMGKQQLVQRMLCGRGRIDSQRLRRNMLRQEDYRRLIAAAGELAESKIYIDDTPGLTLLALRSKARRLKERFGIQGVVIDYLQLMSAGGRVESRQMEVSEISRGVKAMARELDVPVICLSQLNRAAEQREGHRPRMSDLRESGSIEQDADVIMMLHREEYYHRADPEWEEANPDKVGVAELIVAKQRNGPTGTVNMVWDSASTAFRSISYASPPEPHAAPPAAPRLVKLNANAAALPPEDEDVGGIPY